MKQNRVALIRYWAPVILLALAAVVPSLAATGACPHIFVAGAGAESCNGTYTYAGMSYGKPAYVMGAYRIGWQGYWFIADFVGETYYRNSSDSPEPPSDGWIGTRPSYAPAPTLSCADTVTLVYTAGEHGRIRGRSPQTVTYGGDGTQVSAIPDPGYRFVRWSDGAWNASRTERNVTTDLEVTFSVEGGLVFVPAFPATSTEEWSFLTKPVPTTVDAQGYVEHLPVAYAVGDVINVRFGLEDDRGAPVMDARATLQLYQLGASGGGPLLETFGVPYDHDAGAYVTAIPTVSPDLTLTPGLYQWQLVTNDGEILEWLRMELR